MSQSSISVDYGALENATAQIRTISGQIETKLADLRGRLQQIQWEGEDRTAYQAQQAAWDSAMADINQILGQIGAAVGVARENYQTTERSAANLWS